MTTPQDKKLKLETIQDIADKVPGYLTESGKAKWNSGEIKGFLDLCIGYIQEYEDTKGKDVLEKMFNGGVFKQLSRAINIINEGDIKQKGQPTQSWLGSPLPWAIKYGNKGGESIHADIDNCIMDVSVNYEMILRNIKRAEQKATQKATAASTATMIAGIPLANPTGGRRRKHKSRRKTKNNKKSRRHRR
jgi:hypothetical protein